jgi:hypothetical protein
MTAYEAEDDAPLDPAAERLRRKLVRLLILSGGIMMLGFIAVFAAIVYKVGKAGEGGVRSLSAGSSLDVRIAVPRGRRLSATSLDGDRALLTLLAPDGTASLMLIDLNTGATLGRYSIGEGP